MNRALDSRELVFGIGLVTCAVRMPAQVVVSPNPVIARMWSAGMDDSHLQRLAHSLFDSIGPRLPGTAGFKSVSDWIVREYRAWGIDAAPQVYGTWRGWAPGHVAHRPDHAECSLAGRYDARLEPRNARTPDRRGGDSSQFQGQRRIRLAARRTREVRLAVAGHADLSLVR
jgi:hypothetical protein